MDSEKLLSAGRSTKLRQGVHANRRAGNAEPRGSTLASINLASWVVALTEVGKVSSYGCPLTKSWPSFETAHS